MKMVSKVGKGADEFAVGKLGIREMGERSKNLKAPKNNLFEKMC